MLISTQNEDVVQNIVKTATSCSEAYTTLRLALDGWTANGGEVALLSPDSSFCSAEDQDLFNRTLLGTQNMIALQTEAIGIADAYGEESTSTVKRLAQYAVERSEYDANYVDMKTQQIQDTILNVVNSVKVPPVSLDDLFDDLEVSAMDVIACLSLDVNARMSDGSKCDPNLASMIDSFARDAKWKVSVLKQTLNTYKARVDQYKKNVMKAYDVAKKFYNGVNNSVTKWIIDTFFAGDWFYVSLSDMTPVDVTFPDINQIFTDIGTFKSIKDMWADVLPNIDDFYLKLGSVTDGINARFADLITRIQRAYSVSVQLAPMLIPDDYDPPIYEGTSDQATNPVEEVSLFEDKRDLFVSQSRAALGMFSGIGNRYNESGIDVNIPSFNITEIKSKVTTVNLNFESLQQPDIDFDLWFLQFSSLLDRMVTLDYVFRAYMTIKLILSYWFATSLAMPQIDIRVNKDIKNPFRMHPARAIMSFITSPMGGFIIFVSVSLWLAIIVTALYIPLFQSYVSGCVDNEGNGTFITKNLFSLSYNHAYQEGSGLLLNGMDAFDLKRGDTCSSRYASSATLQNNMKSNFTAYANFHKELKENMGLAQRCIDVEKLNSSFLEACCGYPTYPTCAVVGQVHNIACPIDDRREIMTIQMPYELPGIQLQEPACSVSVEGSNWEISDFVFNCDELASCDVTCNEPHREVLASASEQCGCTMEWFLHSKWLGTSLAFLLYLFMNIARVFFFSGVTRLLWKYIYPDRFTVLVTCDSRGKLVTTSGGSGSHDDLVNAIQVRSFSSRTTVEDSKSPLAKDLRAKLSRSLKNFYIAGAFQLVLSFVANGAWIYVVVVVSQSLTPRIWR
eukprot:CCRYP_012162-RA/>CCRYP_012162-RA protein AED:0.10 eAED:0.10 QI:1559/1/1/1/0.75/0.4/5/1441/846